MQMVVQTNRCAQESVEAFFERIYKTSFKQVATYVSKCHGSLEDAKDVFHDALVIYYEIKEKEEVKIFSEEAYILGIAKKLWLRKFNDDVKKTDIETEHESAFITGETITINEFKLLKFLAQSGKKCMDLLLSFYTDGMNIKKICAAFGFANEHSASVQKYKCIEKIRDSITDKAITYEDFLE